MSPSTKFFIILVTSTTVISNFPVQFNSAESSSSSGSVLWKNGLYLNLKFGRVCFFFKVFLIY